MSVITGSCLCGAVTIEITEPLEHEPEACHCVQCRKQTGNFFVGVNVRRTSLELRGEEHVAWFQSSEKVERGFCKECGSTLFWKPTIPGYQWTSIALGCLELKQDTAVVKHTFVAEKGSYYQIIDSVPQREGF